MKVWYVLLAIATLTLGACSSLHDGEGWEHMGDKNTHEDAQPYVLEHDH